MKKIDHHGMSERSPITMKSGKTCCPETIEVKLDGGSFTVELTGDGGGSITSSFHDFSGVSFILCLRESYNHAIDAIESLVLAHAVAGVDIKSPAYIEGLETAIQAVGQQHS